MVDNPSTRTTTTEVSKVIYGSKTLIDLTSDTVTPHVLLKGYTAHDKAGCQIDGSYVPLDTSDATARASDIAIGCTAYVNGQKITGTAETGTKETWIFTMEDDSTVEKDVIVQ